MGLKAIQKKTCRIPANCKAFPFIPIKAPNVLPVFTINEIEILKKNEMKLNLQNLKFLIACIIFFFNIGFFNSLSFSFSSVFFSVFSFIGFITLSSFFSSSLFLS